MLTLPDERPLNWATPHMFRTKGASDVSTVLETHLGDREPGGQ